MHVRPPGWLSQPAARAQKDFTREIQLDAVEEHSPAQWASTPKTITITQTVVERWEAMMMGEEKRNRDLLRNVTAICGASVRVQAEEGDGGRGNRREDTVTAGYAELQRGRSKAQLLFTTTTFSRLPSGCDLFMNPTSGMPPVTLADNCQGRFTRQLPPHAHARGTEPEYGTFNSKT